MNRLLKSILSGRIISPWWILLIDMGLIVNSFMLASLLVINQYLMSLSVIALLKSALVVFLVYGSVFIATKSYRGVIRHTGYEEIKTLSIACIIGYVIMMVLSSAGSMFNIEFIYIPRITLTIHLFISLTLCFIFRIVVKETYVYLTRKSDMTNALIFGAGELGLITLEAIKSDKEVLYNIIGFIDDDPSKLNFQYGSLTVTSWEKALQQIEVRQVEIIILAQTDTSIERKQEILQECSKRNIKL